MSNAEVAKRNNIVLNNDTPRLDSGGYLARIDRYLGVATGSFSSSRSSSIYDSKARFRTARYIIVIVLQKCFNKAKFPMDTYICLPNTNNIWHSSEKREVWQKGDTFDGITQLTGHSIEELLSLNHLANESELRPGLSILLPCFAATYRMEQWDSFDWVGKSFGYRDAAGLAEVNGFRDVTSLDSGMNIKLPDWRFFYARENDTLESIDTVFGLPRGSTIVVGRAYHPDPRLPYAGETVAVPTPRFAERTKKRQRKKRSVNWEK